MGFSQGQALAAIKKHATVQAALEALLAGTGESRCPLSTCGSPPLPLTLICQPLSLMACYWPPSGIVFSCLEKKYLKKCQALRSFAMDFVE